MAFDIMRMEINRIVVYKGIEYRVLDQSGSGLLLVAKNDDVENNKYPVSVLAIPEKDLV